MKTPNPLLILAVFAVGLVVGLVIDRSARPASAEPAASAPTPGRYQFRAGEGPVAVIDTTTGEIRVIGASVPRATWANSYSELAHH